MDAVGLLVPCFVPFGASQIVLIIIEWTVPEYGIHDEHHLEQRWTSHHAAVSVTRLTHLVDRAQFIIRS